MTGLIASETSPPDFGRGFSSFRAGIFPGMSPLRVLPAAAVLALAMLAAPQAAADPEPAPPATGACTGIDNGQAHQACVNNLGGQCGGIGMFGFMHSTCTYPDGSRDECDWRMTSLTTTAGTCQWFASPAPPPIGPPSPPGPALDPALDGPAPAPPSP